MNEPPYELVERAAAYRDAQLPHADGWAGPYPWWCGWAICQAWLAGYHAAEKDREKKEETDGQ